MSRIRFSASLAAGLTCLLASVAIADTAAATTTTGPDSGAVEILTPDESIAGASLGEWHAQWWQWATSLPAGFDCNYGQHGPVFFLPPAFDTSFDCVAPEGTAIYAIVYADVCSSVLPPPNFGGNEEELRACADDLDRMPPSVKVAVNGQEVANLDTYSTMSPMFTLNIPDYSIYEDWPKGVGLSMVLQTGFIIAPPPPGDYVIKVTDVGFSYTVNLTVEAPQIIEPGGTEAPQATEASEVTEQPSTT